ncbi:MAG: S8/S53 family peptidase [Marinirhabdus sp.]|nr:S8/S53 family peptidase [Marinirhabdus sp.]
MINPKFVEDGGFLKYDGDDPSLKSVLDRYQIRTFKKTFKKAKLKNLKKTFFVIADRDALLDDVLTNASHLFEFGEIIAEEDKKIFEPNDYGLTSTIGANIGMQANLDYLDFLEAPKAWYYTTGSPDVFIGISDGMVDTTNIDFKFKATQVRRSTISKGHGYSIAANAAAQGDNGYGIPGICYDCSIYGTDYGDFRNMSSLRSVSDLGAKVINCSWIGTTYYQTAQDVINELFEQNIIVVAAAGNKGWDEEAGRIYYYPASYDHVISVSSVMHKYESVYENIQYNKKGNPYALNVRNYVGRSVGFDNNDINDDHFIYHESTAVLNDQVDILAPTTDIIRFADFIFTNEVLYNEYETTSGATPFVSGTVGLMFSLVPCLPAPEVESILKCASNNIDYIPANKIFAGNYGAGSLNTGETIELLYQLYSPSETAVISGQKFTRWNFTLRGFSKEVVLKDQEFSDASTLKLTAKNRVVLSQNTVLRPNANGSIRIAIDNEMEVPCELRTREGLEEDR